MTHICSSRRILHKPLPTVSFHAESYSVRLQTDSSGTSPAPVCNHGFVVYSFKTRILSELFVARRILTALFGFCGTFVHPKQKEALFLITIDNQPLTRALPFAESKGSGIVGSSSGKIRIENRRIPLVSMVKTTWRKSQHYVERWPIQRGVSEETTWSVADFLMERSKIVSWIFGHASFAFRGSHAPPFALKLKFKFPPPSRMLRCHTTLPAPPLPLPSPFAVIWPNSLQIFKKNNFFFATLDNCSIFAPRKEMNREK